MHQCTTGPVEAGDELLLAPEQTGAGGMEWAVVELVEHHPSPTDLAWNAGPDYPYRVGYRLEDAPDRRGVIWLDSDGRDAKIAVRRIQRRPERP